MEAHNYLIAAPNLADLATLSGGTWSAPLTNLQTRALKQVARTPSPDPAVTWFDVTLHRRSTIRALGLINHNLSRAAKIRWFAYPDETRSAPKWDGGWERAWPRVWTMRQMDFRHKYALSGVPDETETEGMTATWSRVIDPVSAMYWRCAILDPYNVNEFVQAGRVVMAPGWQPEYNADFGAAISIVDGTVIDELEDGGEMADVRPRRRQVTFNLEHLSEAEAKAVLLEMNRRLGVWKEVLFCMDPTSTRFRQHNTIWCRFQQLQPVTQPDCLRWAAPIALIEIPKELSV